LILLAGKRVTRDGVLVIEAGRHRTQEQNRRDARERLVRWVRKAVEPPRARRITRPTVKSKEHRLEEKHLRSETKRVRKPVSPSES
jgi:ribosome-associated protein